MIINEFKIVKILNSDNVVINGGSKHGITLNYVFEIYAPGEEVIDLDTGEPLGRLDVIKAKIRPVSVAEKMTICEGFVMNNLFAMPFTSLFQTMISTKLDVDPTEISGSHKEEDYVIHVGDKVRLSYIRQSQNKELPESKNMEYIDLE